MLSTICAGDAHCAVRQLFDTRHACPQGTLQRICLMRASRCLGRRKHWVERSPAAFSIELSPGGIEQASGIGKARLPVSVSGLGRFLWSHRGICPDSGWRSPPLWGGRGREAGRHSRDAFRYQSRGRFWLQSDDQRQCSARNMRYPRVLGQAEEQQVAW